MMSPPAEYVLPRHVPVDLLGHAIGHPFNPDDANEADALVAVLEPWLIEGWTLHREALVVVFLRRLQASD